MELTSIEYRYENLLVMKKGIVLLLTIVLSFACTGDDDSRNDSQIIGDWKLMKAEIVNFSQNPSIIDYSDENIIYNFKSDGKLVVTGGENIGYPDGEYDYYFGEANLANLNDPVLIVKINNSQWTFNLTDGIMKIGQSYVDGPDLFFKRK